MEFLLGAAIGYAVGAVLYYAFRGLNRYLKRNWSWPYC